MRPRWYANSRGRWPRATLRTHLVAIILAATLPLAAFMSVRIVAEGKLQREALVANLHSSGRALAMVVDRELVGSWDALAGLAKADTLYRGDVAAFKQRLSSRGPLRTSWNRLVAIDSRGQLLFEVDSPGAPKAPTTAPAEVESLMRAWAAQAPERLLFSVLDTPGPQRATWLGVTATTATGERYLLAARVGLVVWQSLLESAAPQGDGYAALFDDKHRVLARTVGPRQFAGQAIPASAVAGMANRPSGVQKTEQLGGGETYVAWQLLAGDRWGVGVGIPAAGFDSAQTATTLWTFGMAAVCSLLGVALALAVARRVVLPLQRLADPLGDTDDSPISVTEIAQLRDAFRRSERNRDELMALETAARRDAETTNRTKDQLLGMLGHELRNPLNAIVTSIEVLRIAEAGSKMADSARDVLKRQVRKLTDIVDELLDAGQVISEQITLIRRPVDLQALLNRSVVAASSAAEKKALRLQLDAVSAWIDADASRIEQVMAELLANAIEHSPVSGTVAVRLAVIDGIASVSVDDSGPGIEAGLLERVFEPFVQGKVGVDRSSGGLGIGLTLVKRLVERHGGSVQVLSSPQGSSFGWRVPVIAVREGSPIVTGALNIALADDNADALTSMRAMLELEGHRVSVATDGPAALTMVLEKRPDLALVDICLPGFDGHEVARRCRAAGYRGRMIAISGYGQAEDLARSIEQGFDAHLVKPIDLQRLLSAIGPS